MKRSFIFIIGMLFVSNVAFAAGRIGDADVRASAAIQRSKLATAADNGITSATGFTGVIETPTIMKFAEQGSAPATPGASARKFYAKSDGFYMLNSAGVETKFATSAANTVSIATKTANYTLTNSDDVIFANTSSGGFTLTLQLVSTATAKFYFIKNIGTNDLTVTANAADLFEGLSTQTLSPGDKFVILPDGGTSWYDFTR